jgi:hypothetical protein
MVAIREKRGVSSGKHESTIDIGSTESGEKLPEVSLQRLNRWIRFYRTWHGSINENHREVVRVRKLQNVMDGRHLRGMGSCSVEPRLQTVKRVCGQPWEI